MKISTEPIMVGDYDDLPSDEQPTIMRSNAREREIAYMLNADFNDEDGRSQWQWFRLPNGDLIFGTFPQGDTYISMAEGGVEV